MKDIITNRNAIERLIETSLNIIYLTSFFALSKLRAPKDTPAKVFPIPCSESTRNACNTVLITALIKYMTVVIIAPTFNTNLLFISENFPAK